jgi:hypothetical protein
MIQTIILAVAVDFQEIPLHIVKSYNIFLPLPISMTTLHLNTYSINPHIHISLSNFL